MVGDAAANARPHMGFGMAKAGTDAMALAKHLDRHDDVDEALDAYNAERHPSATISSCMAASLAPHLGVNLKTEERPPHARSATKRRRHARLDCRPAFSRRL